MLAVSAEDMVFLSNLPQFFWIEQIDSKLT